MDLQTLSSLGNIFKEIHSSHDWRSALDTLFLSMRPSFIFDNIAIYLDSPNTKGLEVVYARAVGRGKTAEADAAWGEGMASEVWSTNKMIMSKPNHIAEGMDRLKMVYLLGLPVCIGAKRKGALVFIRFGGPEYLDPQINVAFLQTFWATSLIESMYLERAYVELNSIQHQARMQDDFFSMVSHELRTPLGFIKGYSTSLLREDANWSQATQRDFLNIIDEEADHLTCLIEDMLEAASLESKTLQFKFAPIQIESLLRDVITNTHLRNPGLLVNLEISSVPPIMGDGARLSQVFHNLFSNAIKYAPKSDVSISVITDGGNIIVTFADNGGGIPEQYLPFIFDRFYRLPADRIIKGTGLGLYICKQIILAHQGTITVESAIGKGTKFIIKLPIRSLQ